MNDNQRQVIRDSAHRLRSGLTYVMLCSHTLKLDLRDVLSPRHAEEFRKMASVLEETKAVLNALLMPFEQLPRKAVTPASGDGLMIGVRTESKNAA